MCPQKSDPDARSGSARWMHWAFDPGARLTTVRTYAIKVFGKEVTAAAWLGRTSPSVLGGACTVAAACETAEGFLEAMAELARFEAERKAAR